MAGVVLKFPFSGPATYTVALPFPAGGQPIETVPNESINYTPSGARYTIRHGPPRWRITRTFESLTEAEVKSVIDFWNAIGGAGQDVAYQYTDKATNVAKSVRCTIIELGQATRQMKNIWDQPIKFEQVTHPNQSSDPAA